MKRFIRFCINHVPRPLLQRVAGWAVPIVGLWYKGGGKGRGVECPVCGAHYRQFMPYGYVRSRTNALCPHCLSLERHRLLWLYLNHETDLFQRFPRTLHIAPEVCLMRHLKRHFAGRPEQYVTADLESPLADLHFDVQQIPLEDKSFDVLICNHLLEHVADDRQAMREFFRILRPNGWGILLSPVELDRTRTYENDSITDPEERTRIFGQYDHRRIYGTDYADRLREAGFEVEVIDYAAQLGDETRTRYALPEDRIYLVRSVYSPDASGEAYAVESAASYSASGTQSAGDSNTGASATGSDLTNMSNSETPSSNSIDR